MSLSLPSLLFLFLVIFVTLRREDDFRVPRILLTLLGGSSWETSEPESGSIVVFFSPESRSNQRLIDVFEKSKPVPLVLFVLFVLLVADNLVLTGRGTNCCFVVDEGVVPVSIVLDSTIDFVFGLYVCVSSSLLLIFFSVSSPLVTATFSS